MRARRTTRPPPPGFALALPPPEVSKEVEVQQKNELFINVDDTSISPMITTDGPRFPNADGGNAPGARFIHLNNTNLFVLMDGVSMFTDGKLAHQENVAPPRIADNKIGSEAHKLIKKAVPASNVDSVEAAIRDIEGDTCPSLTSPVNLSAPPARHAETTRLATKLPLANPNLSTRTAHLPSPNDISSADATTNRTAVAAPVSTKMPVPKGYAALFSNKVKPPVSGGLWSSGAARAPAVKRCGLVPNNAFRTTEPKSTKTNGEAEAEGSDIANLTVVVPTKSSVVTPSSTAAISSPAVPDDMSSVVSRTSSMTAESVPRTLSPNTSAGRKLRGKTKKTARIFSADDVGRTNRTLDLDALETLGFIGRGSQGSVHRVMLDGKLYALKCIDVKEATQAPDAVERQGRKRGLVKELNMIRLQRTRDRPHHLMQMFNAVATLDNERQQLHILLELMSFSMEDAQRMMSRIPATELMKLTMSTFRHHLAGRATVQQQTEKLIKQQSASCMHLAGRNSYNTPEDWELNIDRQTAVPEIILSLFAADVLKGLKELHEDYNIVHCDLKPANVLLDFDRLCFKLADFGCGCQMDLDTRIVRRTGVDLGSKLYKAPERLRSELDSASCADDEDDMPVVQFTAAADVWSLGIMLLELSNGANPCYSFKSDFWNYLSNLKLSRMVKPLSWSAPLYDFIVRCLARDPAQRWPVNKLLQHPFILKYSEIPRSKLKAFMARLDTVSTTFQYKQQRDMLARQMLLSAGNKVGDTYKQESRTRWKSFTGFLSVAPQFQDEEKFPCLASF